MRRRRFDPRPSRTLAVALALAAVGLGLLVPAGAPAAPGSAPFVEEIGALDRFGADARAALGAELVPEFGPGLLFSYKNMSGTAIVIPEARQLWQLYPHAGQTRTGIVVRDLDTLAIVKALTVPDGFKRATRDDSQGGGWSHAIDVAGERLFLVNAGGTHVYEFGLATFALTRRQILTGVDPTNNRLFNAVQLGGMAYDPYEDDLVLLYGGPASSSAVNSNVFLYRLDTRGPATAFDPAGLYKVRACTGPITSTDVGDDTYDWEPLVTEEHLYVPCQKAGHTVIVVRMARPEGADPANEEDVTAGPGYGETVLADQAGGRLFVVTYIGQEIWAFEAATMSFVGVVATGPSGTQESTAYGLDRDSGRVFFQSPHFGLGVVEGRFFPLPQARTHPRRAQAQERILSDATTSRLFVLEGKGTGTTKPRAYRIYRLAPAPAPPAAPDPDANTADVEEREGVTEARFNASGSGYGSRVLLAKGYAPVVPAPTAGPIAPTTLAMMQLNRACGFTDRDVFAGRVARAEYDTGSTAAAAMAVEVDGNTKEDLNRPSRCGAVGADNPATAPPRWGYIPASCSSSAGYSDHREARAAGAAGDRPLGTASAACPAPGGRLEAAAETVTTAQKELAALGERVAVEVQRSLTTVTVERPRSGVRSSVEALAQGVSIRLEGLPAIAIGEIRSKAVSSSDGRPRRKDMSEHDVVIAHVRFGDRVLCEAEPTCDPVELEETLNLLVGGRAVFRTGHGANSGRDEALVEGSRRGAQTAVQKSTARQSSDRALVGDFTVEVPALEVTVFNDNPQGDGWGRARQIYQFAGVASSATYNVVVRPAFAPFPDDGGPTEDLGLPEGADGTFGPLAEGPTGEGTSWAAAPMVQPRLGDGDDDGGGGLAGTVRAVGRGLRLLLTSPRTALLLLTAWALLGSPAVLSRRRRLLAGVRGT